MGRYYKYYLQSFLFYTDFILIEIDWYCERIFYVNCCNFFRRIRRFWVTAVKFTHKQIIPHCNFIWYLYGSYLHKIAKKFFIYFFIAVKLRQIFKFIPFLIIYNNIYGLKTVYILKPVVGQRVGFVIDKNAFQIAMFVKIFFQTLHDYRIVFRLDVCQQDNKLVTGIIGENVAFSNRAHAAFV